MPEPPMKKAVAGLLVAGAIGAAIWYAMSAGQPAGDVAAAAEDADHARDFEAQDVEVIQMGPDGRVRYRLEAERVAQSLETGDVRAENLVIQHDPPGTTPGGQNRWTVTANSAELPAGKEVLTLSGNVRGRGIPKGRRNPVLFSTPRLSYDVQSQDVSSDTEVTIEWGASRFTTQGFQLNINSTELTSNEGSGTLAP
jgi:LPS export ABC transporter protein LptC